MIEALKKNEFLSAYLEYVEDTESPRIFHIWSALAGISAAMGRRVWLPFGIEPIFPNQYVVLVGPPGARKSTALKIMTKVLRGATGVRFAPDDTAGQRQGLISAMQGSLKDEEMDALSGLLEPANLDAASKSAGGIAAALGNIQIDTRDPKTMFVAQSEFSSFLGENASQLLTFLVKMWDGDAYDYQLKSSRLVLDQALLNILGCTTPSQIAKALPTEAMGQGFTSRIIFVYGDEKWKHVPEPQELSPKLFGEIAGVYSHVFHNMSGTMDRTAEARAALNDLYRRECSIRDPRFIYYAERRHTHLIKLCMCIAASCRRQLISVDDVDLADKILLDTEIGMPDALGEFGLTKLSVAKQKLVEFIRSSNDAIPLGILQTMMSRDMTPIDFRNSITELNNAGKISKVTVRGEQHVILKQGKRRRKQEVNLSILEEGGDEQDNN